MIVKISWRHTWNDDEEFVSESNEDDMCMWHLIAMKLNHSELACKQRMRTILDCGIYGEEKKGELIVFLYCFNIKINHLILCYAP